jgi:adenylate cyclase class 2
MNEIEVKAKIENPAVIAERLAALGGRFSEPIVQHDEVFTRKGTDPTAAKTSGNPVLRIRSQGDKVIFTLKQDRENELDCIEKELEVSDKNMMRDILGMLGFEKIVEIHKSRKKMQYNDYEICVDEVEGLGSFIEVEKFSDEPGAKIQSELFAFLKSLGVNESDRVMHGYDTLIWEKENKTKL